MIYKTLIQEPSLGKHGIVIALCGRGISAQSMMGYVNQMGLARSIQIVLEPHKEWYPQPLGVDNQHSAVVGVHNNTPKLLARIKEIANWFHVPLVEIAIFGYSAGGVMALQIATTTSRDLACYAAQGAAILEPKKVALPKNASPILLRHNTDDECFEWGERYLPMRECLLTKGYNLTVEEDSEGGHGVSLQDAHIIGRFIRAYLGY